LAVKLSEPEVKRTPCETLSEFAAEKVSPLKPVLKKGFPQKLSPPGREPLGPLWEILPREENPFSLLPRHTRVFVKKRPPFSGGNPKNLRGTEEFPAPEDYKERKGVPLVSPLRCKRG